MVVTAFYYLSYPDGGPDDLTVRATEMYVERGEPGDSVRSFVDTYAFQVYTFAYVQREFIEAGRPLICRSVMLVPTLDDDWMRDFLNQHVDTLHEWGEPR